MNEIWWDGGPQAKDQVSHFGATMCPLMKLFYVLVITHNLRFSIKIKNF